MQDLVARTSASVETMSQTLVDASIRGTILLLIAILLTLALRKSSAARRHMVWTVALAGLLALPALSAVLPEYRVLPDWLTPIPEQANPPVASSAPQVLPIDFVPDPEQRRVSGNVTDPQAADASTPVVEPGVSTSTQIRVDSPAGVAAPVHVVASPERGWRYWLAAVWLAGAPLMLLRLIAGRVVLQRLLWSGSTQHDNELTRVINDVRTQLQLRRRPVVCISDRRTIPMTWGVFQTFVLLPREAEQWSRERLRMVLLHEFGHIRRRDTVTHVMTQITAGLYWFHPLVWFAVRRVRLEREHACDDLVLRSGVKATEYAEDLAEIVARLKFNPGLCPALGMVHRSHLEDRIMALFDESRNRKRVTGTLAALACGLAAVGTTTLATLHAREPVPVEDPVRDGRSEAANALEDMRNGPQVRSDDADATLVSISEDESPPTVSDATDAVPTTPRAVVNRFLEQLVIGKQTINGIRGSWEHAWRYTTREDGWSVEMTQLARQPAFRAVAELGNDRQVMVLTGTARTSVSSVQDRVGVFELVHRDGVWLIQAMEEYRPEHAWLLAEGFHRSDGIEWILQPEDIVGRFQAGIFDRSEHAFESDGSYTVSRPGEPDAVGTWRIEGNTLVRAIDGEELRNRVVRMFDGGFSIEFGERNRAGYYRIETDADRPESNDGT